MRPLLGLLLAAALLLSGCGGGDDDTASDAATSSSAATSPTAPSAPSTGAATPPAGGSDAGASLLALISQSNVGGEVSTQAAPLGTPEEVAQFDAQFEGDQMQQALDQALGVAVVPDGQEVMGAVIEISCATPEGADVTRAPDGSIVVTPQKTKKSPQECLVPVTTVAVVAVPQADA